MSIDDSRCITNARHVFVCSSQTLLSLVNEHKTKNDFKIIRHMFYDEKCIFRGNERERGRERASERVEEAATSIDDCVKHENSKMFTVIRIMQKRRANIYFIIAHEKGRPPTRHLIMKQVEHHLI